MTQQDAPAFQKPTSTNNYLLIIELAVVIVAACIALFPTQPADSAILYIAIDENDVANLWLVNLSTPDQPEQVTTYDTPGTRFLGVEITDDGRYVAYTMWNTTMPTDDEIWLLDLQTRQIEQLTTCAHQHASCAEYSLRFDGHYLAYYLWSPDELSVRVIDLTALPYSGQTVHKFTVQEEYSFRHAFLRWAGDTGLLTFSFRLPAPDFTFQLQLYDVEQGRPVATLPLEVPSRPPLFASDGSRYVYYETTVEPFTIVATRDVIAVRDTDNPTAPFSRFDVWEVGWQGTGIQDWHPDNIHLLLPIYNWRGDDERINLVSNLAVYNTDTGEVEVLLDGDWARISSASWNSDASQILFAHHERDWECGCAQIMIYDVASGEITSLPIDGYHPLWVHSGG